MTVRSPDRFELRAGALRLALRPDLGGSIAGLWHDGVPLLRSTEPAALDISHKSASYPLVPYSNRLGYCRFTWQGQAYTTEPNFPDSPHSLHGVGWLRPWEVVSATEHELVLRYGHTPDAAWPFAFEAVQHFRLTPRQLEMRMAFTNTAETAQPVGLGWHPYFVKRAGSHLQAVVTHRWESDATKLPTHLSPQAALDGPVAQLGVDHCFAGWSGTAQLRDEAFAIELRSSLPYLVVYTPDHRDYFCVEPVGHVPNALQMQRPADHGLQTLAPGGSTDAWMTLDVVAL